MQRPGKSGRTRGLVDMSIRPASENWTYRRPEGAELVIDAPLTLAPGHAVHVKQWEYKGKTVDFALTHVVDSGSDQGDIARYDCCHSEVHKHQYRRGGLQIARNIVAAIDDERRAWEIVDEHFEPCYEDMFENWQEHFRRWME